MNRDITDFNNPENSNYVEWNYSDNHVKITSEGRIIAVKKPNNDVVVVDVSKRQGADNAFIYGPNGVETARVLNPLKDEGYICFEDVYLVEGIVTLICGSRSGRRACELDDKGRIIGIYETR